MEFKEIQIKNYSKELKLHYLECCGHNDFYWKNDKDLFECKHCSRRYSIKSNTLMHNSNMPINFWVSTLYYIEKDKANARMVKRILNHNRYESIYKIHKVISEALKNEHLLNREEIVDFLRIMSSEYFPVYFAEEDEEFGINGKVIYDVSESIDLYRFLEFLLRPRNI